MKPRNRHSALDAICSGEEWDILVVGGGCTGLGAALEAVTRGYRTLLLEENDFAAGTSSRSTKLIHGGVRYLRQGHLTLVMDALRERGLLLQNAPHLVHPLRFVLPCFRRFEKPYYWTGLKLYDLLSGRLGLGSSQALSRTEVLTRLTTLDMNGLEGGVAFFDAQFDDARLAVALLLTIVEHGGVAVNYFSVRGLIKERGKVIGVKAVDRETGLEFEIRTRLVINATGVWGDDLRKMDDPETVPVLAPSQGAHLVLPARFLPGSDALIIPRTDDGRVLFAIPWKGKLLVGTTDTPVHHISLEPLPLDREIEFLLEHLARYFVEKPCRQDVLSAFAGLRPLLRKNGASSTSTLRRDHALLVSESGLLTIGGGKWTTFRKMGQDAIDRAIRLAGLAPRPSVTATTKLYGWSSDRPICAAETVDCEFPELAELMREKPSWHEKLHPDLPYRIGDVRWAVRREFARTVEDVLSRRTRALVMDARAALEAAPRVAELMASELQLGDEWQKSEVQSFEKLAAGYRVN